MKKVFLLLSALVMTVTAAMATTTTFDFTGSDDVYGLTRYTVPASATYEPSLSVSDDGVDLTFSNDVSGFTLMDARTAQAATLGRTGLLAKNKGNNKIEFKVPGAKITGIKVTIHTTGPANLHMKATYGDTTADVDYEQISASGEPTVYTWSWTDAENDTDVVDFTFDPYFANMDMSSYYRYVYKVEVTYSKDLGGKKESDLSFSAASAEGIVGETFTAPTLDNPHSLPIVWSSTNENVATVDASGNVTLVGAGKTVIKATTEGNDSYVAGSAQYELQVIGVANNIPEMLTMASSLSQKVKVNFPMTVNYCSGANAFVVDSEGNATEIHNAKNDEGTSTTKEDIYVVGDVIPAGWMATNQINLNNYWYGLPSDSNEADRVEVIYPVVEKINYSQDAYKVLVLKDVTFTTGTDATDTVKGVTPDGTPYNFQNTYSIASYPAGTYDVTLVVNAKGTYTWLAPINFAVPVVEDPTFPEAKDLVVTVSGEGSVTYDESEDIIYVSTKVSEDNAVVTLTVPEGWDNFLYFDPSSMVGGASTQAEEGAWQPVADLTQQGFVLGKEITVVADGAPYAYNLTLVKGDEAYMPASYTMQVTATKDANVLADKTVTIDFTTDNYGITGTISANKTFVTYESVVLTNGETSKSFTKGSGFKMNQFSDFTISSIEGPVKEVKIESPTTSNPEDFEVVINEDGVATVKSWYMGQAVVSKITVVFEADGLENAGIAFPAATLQLVNGKDEIKGLVLENPNNLPVTYSSSDYNVTVSENGAISLAENVKGATATITATFAGDSKYRKDEVSYELTIVPIASSINELKELAGTSKSKAYVDFPVVVVFSNLSAAYVQSLDGTEYTYINQSGVATSYPANSIIPQGWIATATLNYGVPYYGMSEKPVSVQTQEAIIEKVNVINLDEKYRVVILKNVDITEEVIEAMPDAKTGNYTITAGEATYTVQNQYKLPKLETPGKYDLKCVIYPYSSTSTRLLAIEYTEAVEDPEPPTPVNGTVTYDFKANDYGMPNDGSSYVPDGTIITEGLSSITMTKGTSNGFRMWNDGLRVYKGAGNTMDIKVEGAQINKIVIGASKTLNVPKFNGEEVSYADKQYVWTGDAESVSIVFSTTTANPIETITIDYTILAPGKDAAELSFSAASYVTGDNEKFFNGAALSNPHEVPVTWTSSNEEVATVTEDGVVAIVGLGKTTITVTSEETADYAAGKASYDLTVVSAATTVAQMLEKAPNENDQVLMIGSLYVAYANGKSVYVYDSADTATLLFGENNYVKGDVIPGGWVATNYDYNGLLEWTGTFPASTQNFADFIEYPEVETITNADINRVVTVPNVEFTEETPAKNVTVKITLPDDSQVELYNKFDILQQAAGKYDVVAAVGYYNGKIQLYPIEYKEPAGKLEYPESLDITFNPEANVNVEQKIAGDGSLQVNVTGMVSDNNLIATIAIPEGWTNLMISNDDDDVTISGGVSPLRANSAYWVPVSQLESMFTLGNVLTVPADNFKHTLYVILVKGEEADYANQIELNIKVKKDLTGVEAIEAVEDGARYFTLDGIEVKNPAKGIYIKVVDGKTTKVVL